MTYAAGLCNVLEASHTEAEYEQIKANHGQPLDVWRLDFPAYNGSGQALSFLKARFTIESECPPCTNWSGPSGSYAKPAEWASSFQALGRPCVALAGVILTSLRGTEARLREDIRQDMARLETRLDEKDQRPGVTV